MRIVEAVLIFGLSGATIVQGTVSFKQLFVFGDSYSDIGEGYLDGNGPTAVEYAVMLALIIVVCIAAITTLGQNADNTFITVGNAVGGTGS